MPTQHIGRAIRFARLSKGLSQEELAKKAGVSDSFISSLESGHRDPSWKMLLYLCDALGVDLTLLAMLTERESAFVKPILPLAYVKLAEEESNA